MHKSDIDALLSDVFREVFKNPELQIRKTDTAADVAGWDSLNHVVLIAAVEARFAIKFRLKDLMCMVSVDDISRLISDKLEQGQN